MKTILVIDVPMLDDGRHLCNECPIWNKERYFCQYDFNMEAKGCPLRPIPQKEDVNEKLEICCSDDELDIRVAHARGYQYGWNDCIDEILGEEENG